MTVAESLRATATLDLVHDSPSSEEKPHTLAVYKASGLQSEAAVSRAGVVQMSSKGRPGIGTRGEPEVTNILQVRLNDEGLGLRSESGAVDSRGEDGVLVGNGQRLVLQVTAVPQAQAYWQASALGSASTEVDKERAVEWIREAVLKKSGVADRATTVLAIDARHAGVLADPIIADLYRSTYSSPSIEFGFAHAWIVGPTPSNCTRL